MQNLTATDVKAWRCELRPNGGHVGMVGGETYAPVDDMKAWQELGSTPQYWTRRFGGSWL